MTTIETPFLSPSSSLADREQARKVAVQLVMAVATSKGSYPEHSLAAANLSRAVGVELVLGEDALEVLALGALLHDVGKLGVADAILEKLGPLTAEEWKVVKGHPEVGARMIEPLEFLSGAIPVIRHHHERPDGSGYPDGLEGEEIPLGARIVAATDAYDAMVCSRPYRESRSPTEAIGELTRGAGSQFDSEVVAILAGVAVP
jgi:putative nucleotidyltransferase with HDIG domain